MLDRISGLASKPRTTRVVLTWVAAREYRIRASASRVESRRPHASATGSHRPRGLYASGAPVQRDEAGSVLG